jgi:hypothetical protein
MKRDYSVYPPAPAAHHVEALRDFGRLKGPRLERIYYPGCGRDTSPSIVFPEARITYVDSFLENVLSLREAGHYDTWFMDADDVVLREPADLAIVFHASVSVHVLAASLAVGGYLICDDAYGTARDAAKCPRFFFDGVIAHIPGTDHAMLVQADLGGCWEPIDTDEALAANPRVDVYRRAVAKFGNGTPRGLVAAYRELFDRCARQSGFGSGEQAQASFITSVAAPDGSSLDPLPPKRPVPPGFFLFRAVA